MVASLFLFCKTHNRLITFYGYFWYSIDVSSPVLIPFFKKERYLKISLGFVHS